MLIVSACGGTSSTGSTQSTPTAAPAAPTATPVPATIQTAQATVEGKTETILTDAHGMTLYYFTPDSPTKLACTGKCAKAWPPVLSTDASTPTSTTSLPGTLSVLKDTNGNQVSIADICYTHFIKDSAPGQVTGHA